MRKFTKQQIEEWRDELRATLKPGDKIYTVLRGVAKSGMSRKIDVYRFTIRNGEIEKRWLSPRVAAICGYRFDEKNECLHVEGGGMDMGFEVVYNLGRALWPEGFATTKGRNGDTSGHDADGGYALRQEWL